VLGKPAAIEPSLCQRKVGRAISQVRTGGRRGGPSSPAPSAHAPSGDLESVDLEGETLAPPLS